VLKKWSIKVSRYLLLLIFLGFFGSTTFFEHVHVVDGVSIVHSHPFKSGKNGVPLHTHTVNGYVLIHFLTNYFTTAASFVVLAVILSLPLSKIKSNYGCPCLFGGFNTGNSMRGPPVTALC
jgi:hypothetical protein